MPRLTELYVATLTRNVEDAGTPDPPALLFSRAGQDLFQIPLGDFDFARGRAGLHRINVENRALDSELLELRLRASGDEAWAPQSVIAWGISGRLPRELVVPLGAVLDLASPFTSPSDGVVTSVVTSIAASIIYDAHKPAPSAAPTQAPATTSGCWVRAYVRASPHYTELQRRWLRLVLQARARRG